MTIVGLDESQSDQGVHCLDGLQQLDIGNSFYVTSDESGESSIVNATKSQNSVEECKFSGNFNEGFELKFKAGEW